MSQESSKFILLSNKKKTIWAFLGICFYKMSKYKINWQYQLLSLDLITADLFTGNQQTD